MQQVLEAPPIRDEERICTAIDGDYPTARPQKKAARPTGTAEKNRQPMTWLRSLMSALTRPKLQSIPAYADTTAKYESAFDRICRIDPYLCMRSLAG
jgi:hypothetical protein